MKPIVKWAGGKTQLLPYIKEMIPSKFNNYFEPFLGGGAVLFDVLPSAANVNDINPELINMYEQVKENPNSVIECLEKIDFNHENSEDPKQFFYTIREEFNSNLLSNTSEQAARFIYLNKHCFNGLYRVNSKGLFNVPFNTKLKGASFDEKNILEISNFLQHVVLELGDFESACLKAKKGDFVFFDSPYAPLNPTSFISYTKEGFEYKDHVRLSDLFKKLTDDGVFCMLTNHNTELVRELYKDFNIKTVQVHRNINSDASKRKGEEVIITNYGV